MMHERSTGNPRRAPRTAFGALRPLGLLLGLAALLLSGCARPAQHSPSAQPPAPHHAATTWYVRAGAAEPHDGTPSRPFATLQQAAPHLGPGDTLELAPGDYPTARFSLPAGAVLRGKDDSFGGPPLEPITLLLERDADVILNGQNVLRDVTIDGGRGVRGSDALGVTLERVVVRGSAGDGVRIDVATPAAAVLVRESTFARNAGVGVRIVTSGRGGVDAALHGNEFVENGGNALQLTFDGAGAHAFDVARNDVIATVASGIRVLLGGPASQTTVGALRRNLVTSRARDAAGNGVAVIQDGDGTASVLVRGNDVLGFGSFGVDVSARDGHGRLDAAVVANRTAEPGMHALAGMRLDAGSGRPGETAVLCLELTANRSDAGLAPGYTVGLESAGATLRLHAPESIAAQSGTLAATERLEAANEGVIEWRASAAPAVRGQSADAPGPVPFAVAPCDVATLHERFQEE